MIWKNINIVAIVKYHESSRYVLDKRRRHECNAVPDSLLYAFDKVFII